VLGSNDDDTLILDNSGGFLSYPVTFTAGLGFDSLIVDGNGGPGISAVYNPTGSDATGFSGNITYAHGMETLAITFTGLSPIESLTPLTTLTINDNAGTGEIKNVSTGPTSTANDPFTGVPATTYEVNYNGG